MMFDRIEGGTKPCGFTWGNGRVIVQNQGCQAAAIHPTTGDLYFSNYQNSLLYRVKKYVIEEFATGKRTTPVRPGTADDADNIKSARQRMGVQYYDSSNW